MTSLILSGIPPTGNRTTVFFWTFTNLPIVDRMITQVIKEFVKVQKKTVVLFPVGGIPDNIKDVIIYRLKQNKIKSKFGLRKLYFFK